MSESEALTVLDAEGQRVHSTTSIQPVRVDTHTGEAIEDFRGYAGVATVTIDKESAAKLSAVLPDEAHDIKPTGEVYVGQVHYRRLLNEVFGPCGWALVPRGPYTTQGNTICREYALVGPGGRFISEAIGEADYQPNNPRMSYASACEAAKSNALTRCCKDIGIASECWDRRWCEQWIAKHAVKVWREEAKRRGGGTGEFQWRRKDAAPFWDERGARKAEAPKTSPEREAGHDETTPPSASVCPHCKSDKLGTTSDGHAFCTACRRGI